MAVLLIQNDAGDSEIRELSKNVPLAIGRHTSNDICIDGPHVPTLHSRISWNSRAYEIVGATEKGVTINGDSVSSALLTLGDCVQIGDVSLFYYDLRSQAEAALNGESPEAEAEMGSGVGIATLPRLKGRKRGAGSKDAKPATPSEPSDTIDAPESLDEIPIPPKEKKAPPPSPLATVFRAKPVRPGEQDIWKSPLVMTLGLGTIVLVLMSLALWFVIGRDASQKAYQSAVDEFDQRRYGEAIHQFEEFLKNYPNHHHAGTARLALGLAKVEQPISGAVPAWSNGLTELEAFVTENRRTTEFKEIVPKVLDLAERVAKGSAEAAGSLKEPKLLEVSRTATLLLQQYSPPDRPPTQILQDIDTTVQKAQAAIRKHTTFGESLAAITTSLESKQPFSAFETRRKLLLKYPDLSTDKSLQGKLREALETEKALVTRAGLDQDAETTDRPAPIPATPLTLLRQTKSRADLLPGETNVFTLAHETCYALDSTTGSVKWKRIVGLSTPFVPQQISGDVLGLLLFDTRFNELLLVRQRDGGLVWRRSIPEVAAAAPLIHAGQIFLPTRGGRLYQFDAVSGKLTAELKFSQPLATSPILIDDGERLLIAGEQAVLYTLNFRPLECLAVTYTGHAGGSIKAPLLPIGEFVLTLENDRRESALLRLWDTGGDQPLTLLASDRIEGEVRDPAALRGKQLVVPSSPERLTSFVVSDEKGEKALTKAGTYQSEQPQGGPIYAVLGADGEIWMTSSTVRRLTVTPESILPQKGELGLGITTQPVQVIDQTLYATSRLPSNTATYFLAADRQQMSSQWLTVLGPQTLAVGSTPANDGSIPLVTDSGDIFTINGAKLQTGGPDSRTIATLPLPTGLQSPLQATVLSNGRLVAWCGGKQARLWQLNVDGIVSRDTPLPESLETAPAAIAGGLLLPLPGKLRLIESAEFNKPVEDLLAKVDPQRPAKWVSVLPVDNRQLLVLNDQGYLMRAQIRAEPVPHIAEVASLDWKTPVDRPLVLIQERAYAAVGKTLKSFDVGTLESRGEVALPDVVTRGPWVVGQQLMMVCGPRQLMVFNAEPLTSVWQQPLDLGMPVGPPVLRGTQLLTATEPGEVVLRDQATGEIQRRLSLQQPIVSGPHTLREDTFVTTSDGSLINLKSWLEAQP